MTTELRSAESPPEPPYADDAGDGPNAKATDRSSTRRGPGRPKAGPPSPENALPEDPRALLNAAPKVRILVHKTGDRNERADVFVGVNGVNYLIPRGIEVDVPEPVYQVLQDAVQTVYEYVRDGERTVRQAQAYPFTRVG